MPKFSPNKNYKYIGKSTNPKDWVFDHKKYDELVNSRKYQEAYDYASQYPMIDPMEEAESNNDLKNMLRAGRRDQFVYNNIDESAYPIIDFRNAVEQSGGLERLASTNTYANEFINYKNTLGGGEKKLKVTFQPQVQKLFGIDWLKRDNTEQSIEAFYEKTGYNKQYLEANGINVGLKDGKPYLEFDKSNNLANTILLNISDYGNYGVEIQGIKDDGSLTKADIKSSTFYSYMYRVSSKPSNLSRMQKLYTNALNLEEKAYSEGTARVKQYSSMFMPLMYDNAITLEDLLVQGGIKQNDFNSRIKRDNSKLIAGLAGIANAGFVDYDISSSYFNDDDTKISRRLSQEDKRELANKYLSQINNKENKIKYGISIYGDKVGLTVIIPGKTNEKDVTISDGWSFTVFGYGVDALQKQINSDPGMQACQEINDMQDLGYEYKDNNGNTYVYDGLGGWIVNGKDRSKSKEYVTKQIHKDKAAQDIGRSITLNNVSKNGALVNPTLYNAQLKTAAFMIANDANKNGDIIEALKLIYGNKIDYTNTNAIIDAIFSLKGVGNVVAEDYEDYIPDPNVYEKLNDIYEVYYNMLNVGRRYVNY